MKRSVNKTNRNVKLNGSREVNMKLCTNQCEKVNNQSELINHYIIHY